MDGAAHSNLRPFPKGVSGNPAGRAPLSPELKALAREGRDKLIALRPAADAKLAALIESGNVHALKIYYDRVVPTLKPTDRCVRLDYPPAASLAEMADVNAQALAAGRVTPQEFAHLQMGLMSQAKIIDTVQLDARLARLEAQRGQTSQG